MSIEVTARSSISMAIPNPGVTKSCQTFGG
jgi:hypothetical protein